MNGKRSSAFWMTGATLLSLFFLGALSIGDANAMTVWTDHATVKIRPNAHPKKDHTSVFLSAAKNEFEPFQLVVTAESGNLSRVDVSVGVLSDGAGHSLPASSIMIYKEAFMDVTSPSTIQGGTGRWPDALIPKVDEYVGEVRNAFPFSVADGESQPTWIEIYVPLNAVAGVYSGAATVTAAGEKAVVVPIQLTVRNFALPSVSTLKTAYSIDQQLVTEGHGLSSVSVELAQLYTKASLLHRISDNYLLAPQQMARLDGGLIDWGPFDETFGPFLDGTVSLPGGKLPGNKLTTNQLRDHGHKIDVPFLRDYAKHFKAKRWFDRLFQYTCDEPPKGCSWDQIRLWTGALHQADPDLRAMVTTSIQRAKEGNVTDLINLLSPTIRFMDDKPGASKLNPEQAQASMVGNQRSKYGPEVWWYQACGSHGCGIIGGDPADDPIGYHLDWPSYMIDLPAMFSRIMEWESFKYNIQGELYYDTVYAYRPGDPWVTQHYFGGNGDGTLYYPGKPSKIGGRHDIPIESIRLKLIREGQEDYEYMSLLKTLGEEAFAQEQVATMVTNTHIWNREPLDLYTAREKMAARILARVDPGAATAPEVTAAAIVEGGDVVPAGSAPSPSAPQGEGAAPPAVPFSGGGGGGCALSQNPTDWKEAISYLLPLLLPFWSVVRRIVTSRLQSVRND